MDNRIMERLEIIEDRIESIKWLITMPFNIKKDKGISDTMNTIRKSAGILGKRLSKGIVFESKIRKEWHSNYLKRIG